MRVFLFKSISGASDAYIDELQTAGYDVIAVQVLHFEYMPLEEVVSAIRHCCPSALIVCSPRAIHVMQTAVESLPQSLLQLPCWVVGPATATAARNLGFCDVRGEESGNAVALAEKITKVLSPPQKLLFLAGDLAQKDMALKLAENNFDVETVVVYQTKPQPGLQEQLDDLLATTSDLDIGVFFSPSCVNYAKRFLERHGHCRLIALGPSTADALTALGYTVAAVAEKPNSACVLNAIRDL